MKEVYKNKQGNYTVYEIRICGYTCWLHNFKDELYQIQVPTGDTPREEDVFDSLVYYHPEIYNADTPEKVIEQVIKFIQERGVNR